MLANPIFMEPDFLGLNLSSATYWGFPGSTKVKNPPPMQEMQEMQLWSQGWEDSPE